jgi:hypothetical protein
MIKSYAKMGIDVGFIIVPLPKARRHTSMDIATRLCHATDVCGGWGMLGGGVKRSGVI